MQLEDLRIALRPRRPWEAVDLGLTLVQNWWPTLLGVWIVVTLPVFLLLNLAISHPFWPLVLFWWFKPAYDRVLLYVLSRAVFGATPSIKETLAAIPTLLWHSGLVWHLTLGRIDAARSFKLPVYQLEGLKGKARRARLQVMLARGGGYGAGLTIICAHMESFVYVGLFALLYLMVPESTGLNPFESLLEDDGKYSLCWNLLAYCATTLIEPFYIASGFSLYLNRRAVLEAWDLELNLRRLATRLTALASSARTVAGFALVTTILMTTGLVTPNGAQAALSDTPIGQFQPNADPQETIEKVLNDPEFGQERVISNWAPIDKPNEDDNNLDLPEFTWLADAAKIVGEIIEVIGWAIAAAALIGIGVYMFRNAGPIRELVDGWRGRRRLVNMPTSVSGLALAPERLPADIIAGARACWAQGQARAALSVLYRGAIVQLLVSGMSLPESATEGDILRRAAPRLDRNALVGLEQLVQAWQRLAYAHREPGLDEFEKLCADYREHLLTPPRAAT